MFFQRPSWPPEHDRTMNGFVDERMASVVDDR